MIATDIRVFLIDDDEDDYIITHDFLMDSTHYNFHLTWTSNPLDGLSEMLNEAYDVYLVDLHLGGHDGMQLIQQAFESGCSKPIILLTGTNDIDVDRKALELGASDYLVKGQFSPPMLERAILYAIRHKQTLNELRLSESRYRAVLESQTELICRFRTDTTLTFVNTAYAAYFGQSSDELIGIPWINLLPESDRANVISHVTTVARNRRPVTYEHKVISDNGELRWQQWTDQPIMDESGGVIEIQSVGIDITDRKKAEESLRSSLERERELGELKSRFITMASHEFRTPLTTIMATASFLEMAEDRLTADKRIARLKKIETAARDMTLLLDDVLVFGKAEANRLAFDPKLGNIVEFCAEIVEDIQASLGKNHQLAFIDNMDSPMLPFDEKLMRQIVTNLVTNAFKYSPEQSQVTVRLESEENQCSLQVQDQGIGIPKSDQQHLFKPFHRARNTGDIQGTGLGLAITQKAVQLHGGDIMFDSVPNKGTCFKVVLPRTQPEKIHD